MDKQTEVFETPDPPLPPKSAHIEEENSITQIESGVKQGYQHFRYGNIDPTSGNFSKLDSKGYICDPWEYDLGTEKPESASERYERLQREISHLEQDLTNQNKDENNSELLDKVLNLEKQLNSVKLNKIYSNHLDNCLMQPTAIDDNISTSLINLLHDNINSTNTQLQDNSVITYNLKLKPTDAKYIHSAQIKQLNERLALLENIVGIKDCTNPANYSLIDTISNSNTNSLVSALFHFQKKYIALDNPTMEKLDVQAGELLNKMDKISSEQTSKTGESELKNQHVAELYAMVKKWNTLTNTIPNLIERLQSLKGIHESAAYFNQTMIHLETNQKKIEKSIENSKHLLTDLQATLSSNYQIITNNFEDINRRIENLSLK